MKGNVGVSARASASGARRESSGGQPWGRTRVRPEQERSRGSRSAIRRVINPAGAWLAREGPPPALRRGPGMDRTKRPRGYGPNARKQENPPLDTHTHARTHARPPAPNPGAQGLGQGLPTLIYCHLIPGNTTKEERGRGEEIRIAPDKSKERAGEPCTKTKKSFPLRILVVEYLLFNSSLETSGNDYGKFSRKRIVPKNTQGKNIILIWRRNFREIFPLKKKRQEE